jgi:hypothetical protein
MLKYTIQIFYIFYAILYFCSNATAQNSPPLQPSSLRMAYGSPTLPRFTAAMNVVFTKCLSCHRNGGSATDFTRYLTNEPLWITANYVVPGKSQSSLLFKYLRGSGFSPSPLGTMPIGGIFTLEELEIFRVWIDQMGNSGNIPTPTPIPGTQSGEPMLASQDYPRMGDRKYVKSVLDQIFGPSAASTTNTLILPSASIFGGSCDSMRQAPASTQNGGDTCSDIDTNSYSAPYIPNSSTLRAGQSMKACNILVFDDMTIQYAIKNVLNVTDLGFLTNNPIPSNANIISAYNLFFPSKEPPPQKAIESLITLATTVRSTSCSTQFPNCHYDPWRYVLLAICYQPDWQVP